MILKPENFHMLNAFNTLTIEERNILLAFLEYISFGDVEQVYSAKTEEQRVDLYNTIVNFQQTYYKLA